MDKLRIRLISAQFQFQLSVGAELGKNKCNCFVTNTTQAHTSSQLYDYVTPGAHANYDRLDFDKNITQGQYNTISRVSASNYDGVHISFIIAIVITVS